MKRPHSAKPIRNFMPHSINQDGVTFDEPIRHFVKIGKKPMLNVMSVSNDLARLLPKKIQHDKEQLYHQNLQLKTSLNQVNEENIRLKTKIALIQREKDRLHKTQNQTMGKGKSANNLNVTSKNEKQNGIVNGLKKIVRQTKEDNENLKAEIVKLKKSLRYTKLNEVQIEKQTIYDQNKKLAKLIQHYETQFTTRVRQDEQLNHLESQLNQKIQTLKEVTSDNIRYEEILEEVQAQNKQVSQKLLIQQKKWQRNFAVQKRKYEQLNKHVEMLKNQVKSLTQKLEEEKKKSAQQKKQVRPASSHPYQNSNSDASNKNKDNNEKEVAIQMNSRLKLELQFAKKKLEESQTKLKNTNKNVSNTLQISKDQTFQLILTKNQPNLARQNKQEEQYGSDFEQNYSKVPNIANQLPLQQKSKHITKVQVKNTPIINEIRQLLTYRLKYNRYTFKQLKSDIEVSPDSSFIFQDLMNMLVSQPFYLTDHYAQQFLRTCYGKVNILNDDELALVDLVSNLRLVVDDFELKDEEEEERMLYKIAENVTKNRNALQAEFAKIKDKNNCVTKNQLTKALKKVSKLSEEEIDLAICYISINTETLQSISYVDFLDRFYINNSKSLSNKNVPHMKEQDELSLGQNQNLDEGQLIADDQLV